MRSLAVAAVLAALSLAALAGDDAQNARVDTLVAEAWARLNAAMRLARADGPGALGDRRGSLAGLSAQLGAALQRHPEHFAARLLMGRLRFFEAVSDSERIAALLELQRAADLQSTDLDSETYGVFCLPEPPYPLWVFKRTAGFVLFDDAPPTSRAAQRALLDLFPCR